MIVSKSYSIVLELDMNDSRPYKIRFNGWGYGDYGHAMKAWCAENFGIRNEKFNNPRWISEGAWSPYGFRFAKESDAALFMLRWG